MRTGTVLTKRQSTDPEAQRYTVRDNDGTLEFFHRDRNLWCSVPESWIPLIEWDQAPSAIS